MVGHFTAKDAGHIELDEEPGQCQQQATSSPSLLCLLQRWLERGMPSAELALGLLIFLFEFLPLWVSAPTARHLCTR